MVFSTDEILSVIGTYFWTLTRISALVMSAPVVSSQVIANKIKIGLIVVLTILIAPLVPAVPNVDPISAESLLITFHQVLIGIAMGLVLQLVFAMFSLGGQIIAYQMGLGFSQMVDPQTGMQVPVISQFYIVLLTLVYFAIHGHLIMIEELANSFKSLPINTEGISKDSMWQLVIWGSQMYVGGVRIALPAIASILLVNLTFGVVTRSAPQFNIFSIGFPITMLMGFFVMSTTFPAILTSITQQLIDIFALVKSIVGGNP